MPVNQSVASNWSVVMEEYTLFT